MATRPKKQNISIQQVTAALLDDLHNFPPAYLHYFSDLEGADLQAVRSAWVQASANRRFMLMESLEILAEDDTLVSFDNLARMALEDEDARVRAAAVRLLGEAEDLSLTSSFLDLMKNDPDAGVRAAAATALGLYVYLGEIEEIPEKLHHRIEDQLIEVASGKDEVLVRRRALEALGYSGRPEVALLICEAYETGETDWLMSAVFAMGRSADDAWAPEVLHLLRHAQTSVQAEAARAAGELELDAARRPLLKLLDDELIERDLRDAVYWALSKIGGDEVRETLEIRLEESEDEEEIEILEDALDNLDFTEEINMFEMLDLDDLPEDEEAAEEYLSRAKALIVNEKGEPLEDEDEEEDGGEISAPPSPSADQDAGGGPKPDPEKKRHRHRKAH